MEDKIEDLINICGTLRDKVDNIEGNNRQLQDFTHGLSDRIADLARSFDKVSDLAEAKQYNQPAQGHFSSSASGRAPGPSAPVTVAPGLQAGLTSDQLQARYRSVSRKYNAVELHPDLSFKFQRSGIKKQWQHSSVLISNTAEYIETSLKIVINLTIQTVTEDKLEDITAIGVALLHYLKAERTSLLVKSRMGEETGSIFRQMQTHSTDFDEECLDTIGKAATMVSHMNTIRAAEKRNARGGFNNPGFVPFSRPPGNFFGPFAGRGMPRYPVRPSGFDTSYGANRGRGYPRGGMQGGSASQATQYDA